MSRALATVKRFASVHPIERIRLESDLVVMEMTKYHTKIVVLPDGSYTVEQW